ncbi:hypothetical protein GCM10028796_23630 [Ramlibacter monticola]
MREAYLAPEPEPAPPALPPPPPPPGLTAAGLPERLASELFFVSAGFDVLLPMREVLPVDEQAASASATKMAARSLSMVVDPFDRPGSGGMEAARSRHAITNKDRTAPRRRIQRGRASASGTCPCAASYS